MDADYSFQADQCVCEWHGGIDATALAIVKAFFEDNKAKYDSNEACQQFAEATLNSFEFLYGCIEERKGEVSNSLCLDFTPF